MEVPASFRFQRTGLTTNVDFTTIVVELPPVWQGIGESCRVAFATRSHDCERACSEVHRVDDTLA